MGNRIAENLNSLKKELPEQVTLVAVSKTYSSDIVFEAYEAGQRDFGENKVQEMVDKYEVLPKDIKWHMIGHLQSNKVKFIVPFVHLIHSVDSEGLLLEINKRAKNINRVVDCLLQIHIAKEETKFGLDKTELDNLLVQGERLENVRIKGLMGMATHTDDVQLIENEFSMLKNLYDDLARRKFKNVSMEILSMGMSGDFKIALNQGSNCIRVGSLIFGNRKYV